VAILAVKPQVLPDVLEGLRSSWTNQLVISIAAGIRLAWLSERMPAGVRLIRVMPNAPALVGAGMSVLALHQSAREEDERLARGVFEAVGRTVVLGEDLMDAVTGLSGSGPAYLCVALEALADGGVKMGLPRETAQRLAAQTAVGAATLLLATGRLSSRWQETIVADCPPASRGIEVLQRAQAGSALANAVAAATRRSRELGA
jgi:pyrroline-5-carboxylate reductase